MRRGAGLAAALAAALVVGCGERAADLRVLLVGVDAGDWEIIRPMAERGELPTFAALMNEGAVAPARTLQPSLSPLLWTSIATGKSPDAHGILDFVTRDPVTGRTVPVTSTLRRVKAVWNIASEFEKRVAVVGWLATWPAEEVNGVMVTDRVSLHPFDAAGTGHAVRALTHPPEFAGEIARLVPSAATVPFDSVAPFLKVSREEYDAAPFEGFRPGQLTGNFRRTLAAAEGYRRIGLEVGAREPWDLLLTYFEFVDATSHLFVRHMPPPARGVPAEEAAAYGGAVEAAYRWQDRVLGEILRLRDERTVVLVVSDHGFLLGGRRIAGPSDVQGGEAAAWHRDEGVFAIAGPGVKRGEALAPVSILDVTPTILWLLGLPVAEDMAGRPIREAFEAAFVARHPLRTTPTFESEERSPTHVVEGEEDAAIQERLRALGYLASEGVNETMNRAILLRDRGDFAGAAVEWAKARAMAPQRTDVAVGLGYAYFALGRRDSARAEWERAVRIDAACVDALLNLGNLAYEEGRVDEAVARYDGAIGADSSAMRAYVNLGQVLMDQRRFADAARLLRRAASIVPGDAQVRFRLGVALAEMGSTEGAFGELRRALALDRDLAVPVGLWLGRLLERSGDDEAAAQQFEEVLGADPRSIEAHLRLARVSARLGRRDRAGQLFVRALGIDPQNEEAKRGLEALTRLGAPGGGAR